MCRKKNRIILFAVIWICIMSTGSARGADKSGKKPFLYVAMGNSITHHDVCHFWFHACGMGASKPSRDYVHKTISGLKKAYGKKYSGYSYTILQATMWEINRSDRKKAVKEIEELLKKKPQLFTFMFGESFRNTYMVEKDLTSLVRLIQKRSPKTAIVLIGNFIRDRAIQRECDEIKKRVAEKCDVAYVDLSSIAGQSDYQLGYTILYDSKGGKHRVKRKLVAKHPNDKGMAYISEQVVAAYRAEVKKTRANTGKQENPQNTKKQTVNKTANKKGTNKRASLELNKKKGNWKTVRKKGRTYRRYYDDNGKLVRGMVQKPKVKKIGNATYAFDKKGYMLTGVQVIREKLYYFADDGKLQNEITSLLQAASAQEQETAALKNMLSELGCPLKKEVYYRIGCRGSGVDGSLYYPGFEISVFRYDDGRVVVISIVPSK